MSRAGQPIATPAVPAERVVVRLRRHARVLLLPVVVLLAVTGIGTYFFFRLADAWQRIGVVAASALVVLLAVLLPLLAWLTERTTITTRRIILRSGVFVRVRQELLHSRGYDVVVRRTWWQGLWRSGDVRINTGHERPVVLRDVPGPTLVQSALQELMGRSHSIVAERRRAEQSTGDATVAWGRR